MRAPRAVAQVIELSDKYADHAAQKQNLMTYLGELGRRDFAAEQTGFAPELPVGMPADFRVAGTESCKECHERSGGRGMASITRRRGSR